MLREQQSNWDRNHSGVDILLVLVSFVLCHKAYLGNLDFSSERFIVMASALISTYVIFSAAGLYRPQRKNIIERDLGKITISWALVVLLVALIAFLTKIAFDVSRVWFSLSAVISFFSLLVFRFIQRYVVARSRRQGDYEQPVVIVGVNDLMRTTMERVADNPWIGYKIVGVFGLDNQPPKFSIDDSLYKGAISNLVGFLEASQVNGQPVGQIWIVLPLSCESHIKDIISNLRAYSVDICLIPNTFGMQVLTGSLTNAAEITLVNFTDIRLRGTAEFFKSLFDRAVAFLFLILFFPVLLLIALFVKLDSKGPVLFSQRRYGINGREILVWKFRSMYVQEDGSEVLQVTRNDARVTRVGSVLRRYSLDELPQFFNVLQGSMSIVGPRPHAVSHNEEFRHRINGYMLRHKVKPGITGWAQINGWRGETDTLEKMEQRVLFDLDYIRNWSAWLDVKIILLTVARAFNGKDAY